MSPEQGRGTRTQRAGWHNIYQHDHHPDDKKCEAPTSLNIPIHLSRSNRETCVMCATPDRDGGDCKSDESCTVIGIGWCEVSGGVERADGGGRGRGGTLPSPPPPQPPTTSIFTFSHFSFCRPVAVTVPSWIWRLWFPIWCYTENVTCPCDCVTFTVIF